MSPEKFVAIYWWIWVMSIWILNWAVKQASEQFFFSLETYTGALVGDFKDVLISCNTTVRCSETPDQP